MKKISNNKKFFMKDGMIDTGKLQEIGCDKQENEYDIDLSIIQIMKQDRKQQSDDDQIKLVPHAWVEVAAVSGDELQKQVRDAAV